MNVLVIDTGGTHVKMLFPGPGTGSGSALIVDGIIEPMELGHLPYKKAAFEDHVGVRGLEKHGKKKWRLHVADVVERLIAAIEPEEVVLGGGHVHKLKKLSGGCRMGDNTHAFRGGFRLWDEADVRKSFTFGKQRPVKHQRTRFDPREKVRKTQV